ncbi:hypothetical protein CVT24_009495 [Panaeolus cyanescens]|uniref:CCHC-type domain-containing protein n=1 Tax=Panaeolus cyanescens TaxID=181874 RepID=A0A409VCM5_9AGAR|nr:hypothetical protein CVT24_009495 [Panaeolus cyanescens]
MAAPEIIDLTTTSAPSISPASPLASNQPKNNDNDAVSCVASADAKLNDSSISAKQSPSANSQRDPSKNAEPSAGSSTTSQNDLKLQSTAPSSKPVEVFDTTSSLVVPTESLPKPSKTGNAPDATVGEREPEKGVVEVAKTPAPRRTRKRARKSASGDGLGSASASGKEDNKEKNEGPSAKKENVVHGQRDGGASKNEKEQRVGEKRKRGADDDGEEGQSKSRLEDGEVLDAKMDVDVVEIEPPRRASSTLPDRDSKNVDESESSTKSKSKPKSRSKSKPESKAKSSPKPESKSKPRSKAQSSSQSQSQPQPKSQSKSTSKAQSPAPQPEKPVSREAGPDLFYIDVTPTAIPTVLVDTTPAIAIDVDESLDTKLLVPAHVTVLGSTPVEIIEKITREDGAEEGEEEEDYIDYLDYDDVKGITRYFETPPDASATLTRTVCKNCGAEGEHKTSACPVQICLTCGARNEHSTRSCPISKVCFTCGMKGHINANCPNRRSGRAMMSTRDQECDRCFSSFHKTPECPTWWRIYEYFSTEGQSETLKRRMEKKGLLLGKGGEAYVADDEWCYNCGSAGHWGDDCDDARIPPNDYSAFSSYNVMKSPFYDAGQEQQNKSKSTVKRNLVDELTQWPGDAPDLVGKKGKAKAKLALQQHVEKVVDTVDEDDWFGNRNKGRGGASGDRDRDKKNGPASTAQQPPKGTPTEPKKMRFAGISIKGMASKVQEPQTQAQGALLGRIDFPRSEKRDSDRDRGEKKGDRDRDRDRGGSSRNDSGFDRKKDGGSRYSESSRDKGRWRDRDDGRRNGRRYTGGYAR